MAFATRILGLLSHLILTRELFWLWMATFSLAPIFPLSNFVGHPHWDNIRWTPFQDASLSLTTILIDVTANIIWFIPLGALLYNRLTDHSTSLRAMAMVILITGGISCSIEFYQVFCHNRFPSVSDVLCNVSGAAIGGYLITRKSSSHG